MKKFLICILIITIFSTVIFFCGLTTIKVKTNEVGVVVSKTHGIDSNVVTPGKLNWNWRFLLPTNAELRKFNLNPVNTTRTITGRLPSAEIYSGFDFNYSFTYSISLTTNTKSLIKLLENNIITNNDDLTEYLTNAADALAQLSTDYLLTKIRNNPSYRVESTRREDILRSINFYDEYPYVDFTVFAITDSKIPDFELYETFKNKVLSEMSFLPLESVTNSKNITNKNLERDDYE